MIAQRRPPAQTPAPREDAGLTSARAAQLLEVHGENAITAEKRTSPLRLLAGQLKGALVWLLVGATVLSAALGEVRDAVAIAVILVVNAAIGFFQELRAEKAILALSRMAAPHARVVRDGAVVDVAAAAVVPGNLLVLEAGDVVAADGVVVSASRLKTNEAALTGESVPVDKRVGEEPVDAPLAERHGRVYAGTAVADGSGRAVVAATGMKTELGKIAALLTQTHDEETPLQKRLERVGRTLLVLCTGIVVLVAAVGLWRGTPPLELLMTSVSLAVAAVPEGLAAIVTIALAVGVQRMVAQNVLIRRLPAVETLGCATVICTDKTGTLTTGRMRVREVWAKDRKRTLRVAVACSDAELSADGDGGTGDPTEVALLIAAAEDGTARADVERLEPRIETHPFDAERKRMSVFRRVEAGPGRLYVKGALELLLPLCREGTTGAVEANADMAERGLRVLAVAVGDDNQERDLELVGLVGIADPPRTEAVDAVAHARKAGIKTIMITGDHPATAAAIARELGIVRDGDDVKELVHARATPAEKLALVREEKAKGQVVAMTGDGVNDAPALKEADIGIAMGKGTEVTREAADMILVDDNFASIVAAVREGRGVYDNIQKALVYLLAGNIGELAFMLLASALGAPLPLTPLQLLWINLVTDGLPALALVFNPTDPDVLGRRPRRFDEQMLGRPQWTAIVLTGMVTASVALGVFFWALSSRDVATARNLAFSTIVIGELLRAFAARSTNKVFFETPVFGNVLLLGVVLVSVLLQLGLHFMPFTAQLFNLRALTLEDGLLSVGLGLVPVTVVELSKLARRAFAGDRPR